MKVTKNCELPSLENDLVRLDGNLSKNRTLCITRKNGKLDLFIQDTKAKSITQILTFLDIEKIEWKEAQILHNAKSYFRSYTQTQERKQNLLFQAVLSAAYNEKTPEHIPPPIFGMKLDDSVFLDTEQEEKDDF